ncbi:MAG: AsmA family protein, partial [Betaproteobacteria bacterium]|nr:AsmA family protein [Betaproteobacteria bacterium]
LVRLGGEGDINIGTDSMDYLAKATLVATAAGQGGKDASELKGITVPVRISGPFTSLSYKLDFNAMISGAAQQKIDEKKEEIKTKAQDKLKDQLKGLFGR